MNPSASCQGFRGKPEDVPRILCLQTGTPSFHFGSSALTSRTCVMVSILELYRAPDPVPGALSCQCHWQWVLPSSQVGASLLGTRP